MSKNDLINNDVLWRQYIQEVQTQTGNRIIMNTMNKGGYHLYYENTNYVQQHNHNWLSKIPLIETLYLGPKQKELAKKDDEVAKSLSSKYGTDGNQFYHTTSAVIHEQIRDINTFMWGSGLLIGVITIGSLTAGYYSILRLRKQALAQTRRVATMLDRRVENAVENALELRRTASAANGRRAANIVQGAAADGTHSGGGVLLANETESTTESTSLLSRSGESSTAPTGLSRKSTRGGSLVQRFRSGLFSKGSASSSSSSLELVSPRIQGWDIRHEGLYCKDIKMNFKQEIFGRLKDGHQTFSHDGRMPVKRRKAIRIMEDMGFKSHGNFNGHEKFSHPLFEPYPPGVSPVNCWFNFMNGDTVDMNFMAKMLHRRYGNPLLTFGQLPMD